MNLEGIVLKHGSHKTREDGVCAMEAVAWLANEPRVCRLTVECIERMCAVTEAS